MSKSMFKLRGRYKLIYIACVYFSSVVVTAFWSACFWLSFYSPVSRVTSNDMFTPWLLLAYSIVFIIYSVFYYFIMKSHYEWVKVKIRGYDD